MKVEQTYKIMEKLENVDIMYYRKCICLNIVKFRKELYKNYKEQYKGCVGEKNPYSTENISAYLGISKVHYKRLENPKDKNKFISLDNLIKLSFILNHSLDEFLNINDWNNRN